MLEYKFDTQLLIEGTGLDEDKINDYITANIKGDCLLAVGDDELIKIHYHTNEPWQVLEYWNTAPRWATSTISWWRTWSASPPGWTAEKHRTKGAGAHACSGSLGCSDRQYAPAIACVSRAMAPATSAMPGLPLERMLSSEAAAL